jgi:hypothetical protein
MQDWDEFGVRVPLTVLWIDECMVRGRGKTSCCWGAMIQSDGSAWGRQPSRHGVPLSKHSSDGCRLLLDSSACEPSSQCVPHACALSSLTSLPCGLHISDETLDSAQ